MCCPAHACCASYMRRGVAEQVLLRVHGGGQGVAVRVGTWAAWAMRGADVPGVTVTQEVTFQLNEAKHYHGDCTLLSLPDASLPGNNVCAVF